MIGSTDDYSTVQFSAVVDLPAAAVDNVVCVLSRVVAVVGVKVLSVVGVSAVGIGTNVIFE